MAILKFKNISLFVTIILSVIVSGGHDVCAQSLPAREYQIKAGFISNFLKFIEWPASYHLKGNLPICIIGEDPFGNIFDMFNVKAIKENTLITKHFNSYLGLEVLDCNVIFISSSEKDNLDQILKLLTGSNILTISDTDGFAQRGVIINFYLKKDKVRFEINVDAAKRAGLKISSKLLRLAKRVHDATK